MQEHILLNGKIKILESAGWHTWYNPNYWVHQKLIKDPLSQDYTNYGLNAEDAYIFETTNQKPFSGQLCGHLGGVRW